MGPLVQVIPSEKHLVITGPQSVTYFHADVILQGEPTSYVEPLAG